MIDELIHYCIQQIGLDGEAGTDIGRLAHFVNQFHSDHSSRAHQPNQLVDAPYHAFVFRQLLTHPDVSVGLFVPGVPVKGGIKSGIFRRRASGPDSPATSKFESKADAAPMYDWVELLPDQILAEQQGLFQLQQTHADRLRLVLQPNLIKRLLVGATDTFLPPSAYRVLQIICRSRETPVLSTDIGSALHTDQKTVFYMCKRLIDLNLITKIKARETGTVASYFVATSFEDRCEILIQQRNADVDTDLFQSATPVAPPTAGQSSLLSQTSVAGEGMARILEDDAEGEPDAEDVEQHRIAPTVTVKEEEPQNMPFSSANADDHHTADVPSTSIQSLVPTFEYVDPAKALLWITSRPELVRFRIYLLCNATSSKVTARIGLVRRINLDHTRAQRRAFIGLLERAIVDGLLEVVNIHVASTGRTHRGLRMTPKGENEMQELLSGEYGDSATVQEHIKARRTNAKLQQDLSRMEPSLPRELTFERYVYEEIARAGPSGRTILQLMAQLHATGHFARTLDQLAQRAEDANGEPSMSDLQVRSFHEHKQRVRSTKLYSHHAWVLQAANEGLLHQDDLDLLASAGGPSSFHTKSTAWTSPKQIGEHLAALSKDLSTPIPRKGARLGRPPKKRTLDDEFDPDKPPPKRGRPRKHPILTPDTDAPPPKRGRPRKHPFDSAGASSAATDTSKSTSASSSRLGTPTPQDAQQLDLLNPDTPCQSANMTEDHDDAARTASDPSTAGLAKRRSTRLLRGQATARPSSLLVTSSVTAEEPVPSQSEGTVVPEPAVVTSSSPKPMEQMEVEQVESQDGAQTTPTDHTKQAEQGAQAAPELFAPSANLSRVDDLLAAPTPVKRESESLSVTPAAKKFSEAACTPATSERRKRTNLTQLRSSHALVQCVREAGGAMDTLLIPDLLSDFVERTGFASDAQLVNLRDRKVREKALSSAINNALLCRTYLRLGRPSAVHPKRQVIYLPELPAEKLQRYCEDVKEGRDGWTDSKNMKTALTHVTDSVAIGMDDAAQISKPWHTQEPYRLSELPQEQAQLAMLRQPFRDVISVWRQHLGFVSGEMTRLKAFHHACARFIKMQQRSSDHDEPAALPLSFFWTQAPLDLYLGLVPVHLASEAIEQQFLDPHYRAMPVQELPIELRTSLGLLSSLPIEAHVALYSLATQLSVLGIFKLHAPAQHAETSAHASGTGLDKLEPIVEPLHRIPLYNWAVKKEEKPLINVIDVGLAPERINQFWAKMQACCLNVRRGAGEEVTEGRALDSLGNSATHPAYEPSSASRFDLTKTVPEELSYALYASKAWRAYHQLRPSQTKFLYRIDLQDLPAATQADLDKLAYVTLVPQQVVRAVLSTRLEQANQPEHLDDLANRRNKPRFSWPLKLSTIPLPAHVYRTIMSIGRPTKPRAEREREGRATTLSKARQLRDRRESNFQAMLEQAFSEAPGAHNLREKIETALLVIRKKFVAGDVRFDAGAVQKAISRAIRSASGIRSMPALRAPSAGRRQRQAKQDSMNESQGPEQPDQEHVQDQDEDGHEDIPDAANGEPRARRDRRNRRKNTDQAHFWTPARKELLRDAAVILRVRDQVRGRSDWSALFQVIDGEERTKTKGVIMAQWRSQYYRMRSLHGEEAYLAALESQWIPVYLSARNESILHDPDFPSAGGFDLAAQIELLREKIDKNQVQRSLTRPVARHRLPLELTAATDFTNNWKEEFAHEPVERRFEAFFTGELGVTARRFEALLNTAFGKEADEPNLPSAAIEDRMAEWAVRIIIATASPGLQDHKDPSRQQGSSTGAMQVDTTPADELAKADFCREVGDIRIEAAMQRLLDDRLIRCLAIDPLVRRKPGTNFVFTEELLKLLPDPNADTRLALADLQVMITHRRSAFQEVVETESGLMVEPMEADSEAAAIVQLMQAGLMNAEIDMQPFETLRQNAAFNARVLNDEDLEALINIKGGKESMSAIDSAVLSVPALPADRVLEWMTAPQVAVGAVADADTLRDIWFQEIESKLNSSSATDASSECLCNLATLLIESGPLGVSLSGSSSVEYKDVVTLTSGPLPVAFFSPLSSKPMLVASPFVRNYALTIPNCASSELKTTLPHIWTTLNMPLVEQWRCLLDTIMAFVLQRPGVSVQWVASRFSASDDSEKGAGMPRTDRVGVSFNDVWSAVCCLVECEVVEISINKNTDQAIEGWTLHPSFKRTVWAGFR
ncbi:uncharacterized protein MEPE_05129 [Melanopsichium pennsylvanicum]|uniref:B-block binding subunit of TFIIIC domain-containing protein n=2 Tax=Melanopsichium pennsylvanicum TaxID=63383 RepID=A0AAJ4XPI4_9BASI|nr:putative protein [Melanopsichium pennsylvanicum 4]SNX86420.1 uncharacterized protein MEPE_05129 [Melanopsichium pennsylvanicum]